MKIKKLLMSLLFLFILIIGCFYLYLTNSIDLVMPKEKQMIIFTKIKESEDLPKSFYIQYEKLNPNGLNRSYTVSLLSHFSTKLKKCACEEIYAHPGFFDNYNRLASSIFIYEVNKMFGGKKCLDFALQNADFTNGIKGIKLASKKYFGKEINELNENEVLDMLIIYKNPSFYTRRKDKLIDYRDYILSK